MHIISSRYQDVANDYDDYDYDYDDYEKDKNNKSTNRITMRSSSTSSSTLVSFPSRILMLLLVGLYSVAIALALRPSPSSSSYSSSHLHLHSHSHFSRPTSSSSSQTSSSIVAMEAVPGKKFNNLRKKLFSRTRRGYRNDGDDAGDAGDAAGEDEIGETVVETDELIILKENVKVKDKNKNKNRYSSYLASSSLKLRKKKKKQQQQQPPHVVETVEELRSAILDQQLSLSDTAIVEPKKTPPPPPVQLLLDDDTDDGDDDIVAVTAEEEASSSSSSSPPLMDHAVRNLIKERYLNGSTPGNRLASDNSTLALAIEGGGMRGCVSAGMAAAITALGLSDAIDTIYGSSAGSVVGAYMVSRQVCLDVYVDILPASKKLFVCKKRMLTNLASLSLGRMLTRRSKSNNNNNKNAENRASLSSIRERLYKTQPGMNISFVLDGIMGNDHGLRPLDIDAFQQNDMKQKLRVVSSCVDPHTGKLFSKCFGSDDFFHDEHAVVRVDHQREGLFACLQASMTVPGATGPPVNLVRKKISNNSTDHLNGQQQQQLPLPCFDAFCFEPIPYRSAVEEGATHVLVLATRPEDFVPKTKPSIYESGVAPLYFNSHGHSSVAEFFEQGGQQYVYAEDLMLLEEAKRMRPSSGSSSSLEEQERGALIPPPEILYGVPRTNEITQRIQNREQNWNRAHLFPLRVPKGHKELEVLDQDKDAVLEAVRGGFMTAFDSLSDLVGLEGFRGKDVAEMIFPSSLDGGNNDDDDDNNNNNNNNNNNSKSSTSTSSPTSLSALDEAILGTKLHVPGEPIREYGAINSTMSFGDNTMIGGGGLFGHGSHHDTEMNQRQRQEEFSRTLLQCLPGFQDGRYGHLAKGLRQQIEQGSGSSSCSSSSSSTGYVRPNSRF